MKTGVLVLSALLGASSATDTCTFEGKNASYDLTPLRLDSSSQVSYYTVRDSKYDDADTSHNFTYDFNICGALLNYPTETSTCQNAMFQCSNSYLNTSTGNYICEESGKHQIDGEAYAYQLRLEDGEEHCHVLSNTDGGPPRFELLDSDDPASGVVLVYSNGEWCGDTVGRNRELRLRFECENDAYNIPDAERVEEEDSFCAYNITIKSLYGCPTQCGIYGNDLCSAEGLCEYDWSNEVPQCFCYWGQYGTACEHEYADAGVATPSSKRHPNVDSVYVNSFEDETFDDEFQVIYDLSEFQLTDTAFRVNDSENDFVYYFNLFEDVPSTMLPTACQTAKATCDIDNNPTCEGIGYASSIGAAWQLNKDLTTCYLLGTKDDYDWTIYDVDDAARGASVTYTSGGYCDKGGHTNREFTINFKCPDSHREFYEPSTETEFNSYVYEDDEHQCGYTLTIESALACPYQCISDAAATDFNELEGFSVCGQRGVCAADPNAKFARCLCDDGWTGDDCNSRVTHSKSSTDDHTGLKVAVAIITILVVALIGIVIYLYLRNRTLEKYRGHLLDDEQDEVAQPPFPGGEPKVPDDLYSDSEPSDEEDRIHQHQITITQPAETDADVFVAAAPDVVIPTNTMGGGDGADDLHDVPMTDAPRKKKKESGQEDERVGLMGSSSD